MEIKIDDQIDIIIQQELDKLFKLSTQPSPLDENDVKRLEAMVKLHELRKKSKPKEDPNKESLSPEELMKIVTKKNDKQ